MLRKCLVFSSLLPFCLIVAHAQSEVDVTVGLGTAQDKSNGQTIDPLGTGTSRHWFHQRFVPENRRKCDVQAEFRRGLRDFFPPGAGDYAGLQYRPLFYDFNGVYKPPVRSKRFVPELQAGLGGVNVKFYANQQLCNSLTGCSTSNSFLTSANHFQVHLGGGIRYYFTDHIFVRPEIDAHWVSNFTQFGNNWVPQYGMSVGYTLGSASRLLAG